MAEQEIVKRLIREGLFVATAESLTAGKLGSEITRTPGASETYLGGVVAYQNSVKELLLSVSPSLISNQGAVDPEVAAQMASGVRNKFSRVCQIPEQKVIGVSTTGVAGPAESEGKVAGTVYIGISSVVGESVYSFQFSGDRESIREQSVAAAMESLWEQIQLISGY